MERIFKVVVMNYFNREYGCKYYSIELREYKDNRSYNVIKKVKDFNNVGDVLFSLYELQSKWFKELNINMMNDIWNVKVDID